MWLSFTLYYVSIHVRLKILVAPVYVEKEYFKRMFVEER